MQKIVKHPAVAIGAVTAHPPVHGRNRAKVPTGAKNAKTTSLAF